MEQQQTAVIIGGSHAAAQLALSMRQQGWAGQILVISADALLPYHRLPLSKAYLAGQQDANCLLIRAPAAYQKLAIEFRLNTRVLAVDANSQSLTLSNRQEQAYDKLALCTGARVRRLSIPGVDLAGVHYLRDLADADAIKQDISKGAKAVIIGGGYIGLETAALLTKLGMQVTVLEAMDRVLQRVTAEPVSTFYHRIHSEEGVAIRTGCNAIAVEGSGRASGVLCDSGERIAADLVMIGIGVIPNTELIEPLGLAVNNGIVVDEFARTENANIVAAGDCTSYHNRFYERQLRLESVPNSLEQAKSAAASICGQERAYSSLPWFWSDQYDLKLQIAGLNEGYDSVQIRGDNNNSRSFVAWYLKAGKLIAADCINRPIEFVLAKKLISAASKIPIKQLIDDSLPVQSLLAQA